jgi:hypothetical protein
MTLYEQALALARDAWENIPDRACPSGPHLVIAGMRAALEAAQAKVFRDDCDMDHQFEKLIAELEVTP